jgi:hypothetical protein
MRSSALTGNSLPSEQNRPEPFTKEVADFDLTIYVGEQGTTGSFSKAMTQCI